MYSYENASENCTNFEIICPPRELLTSLGKGLFENIYSYLMLEVISSNVAYFNIHDPSIDKYAQNLCLLATKICSVYSANGQMYLFPCVNDFLSLYCKK